MCAKADVKPTGGGVSNESNLFTTSEQSARKGKMMQKTLVVVKAGIDMTSLCAVQLSTEDIEGDLGSFDLKSRTCPAKALCSC